MPVPRVITSSVPLPSIAARPCTPASLATRAGRLVASCSASAKGKPAHMAPRLGAVWTVPSTTTPGKPAATRSKGGIWPAISRAVASTAAGSAGCGVGRRTRSAVGRPSSSTVIPLMPVPPTSRQNVMTAFPGGMDEPSPCVARRRILTIPPGPPPGRRASRPAAGASPGLGPGALGAPIHPPAPLSHRVALPGAEAPIRRGTSTYRSSLRSSAVAIRADVISKQELPRHALEAPIPITKTLVQRSVTSVATSAIALQTPPAIEKEPQQAGNQEQPRRVNEKKRPEPHRILPALDQGCRQGQDPEVPEPNSMNQPHVEDGYKAECHRPQHEPLQDVNGATGPIELPDEHLERQGTGAAPELVVMAKRPDIEGCKQELEAGEQGPTGAREEQHAHGGGPALTIAQASQAPPSEERLPLEVSWRQHEILHDAGGGREQPGNDHVTRYGKCIARERAPLVRPHAGVEEQAEGAQGRRPDEGQQKDSCRSVADIHP